MSLHFIVKNIAVNLAARYDFVIFKNLFNFQNDKIPSSSI